MPSATPFALTFVLKEIIMAKRHLVEEFHLSFFVPRGLPVPEVRGGRRALASAAFRRKLRTVLADAIRRMPALRRLSFEISW